jgi:hypothetical protein
MSNPSQVHAGFFVVRRTPWAEVFLRRWLGYKHRQPEAAVWDVVWGDRATGAAVTAVTAEVRIPSPGCPHPPRNVRSEREAQRPLSHALTSD